MKIEKILGEDKYVLDTQNFILKYSSYEGDKEVVLDEDIVAFDVGRIGDGCGGGRIFLLYKTYIKAFNPENKEFMLIFENLENASSIEKKGCDLFVEEKSGKYIYNLATMKRYDV